MFLNIIDRCVQFLKYLIPRDKSLDELQGIVKVVRISFHIFKIILLLCSNRKN